MHTVAQPSIESNTHVINARHQVRWLGFCVDQLILQDLPAVCLDMGFRELLKARRRLNAAILNALAERKALMSAREQEQYEMAGYVRLMTDALMTA